MYSFTSLLWDYLAYFFGVLGGLISLWQAWLWYREWQENRIDRFSSVEKNGLKLIDQIEESGFDPDMVLGIGRSGAFLGGWLAGNLGTKPIEVIDRKHEDETDPMYFSGIEEKIEIMKKLYGNNAKVLVVMGATTGGGSFNRCSQELKRLAKGWVCKYAAIYEMKANRFPTDYVVRRIKYVPQRYPWHKKPGYRPFLGRVNT